MADVTSFLYHQSTTGIGGAIAGEIVNASNGNVFPNVTSSEADSGVTKYRCVYVTAGGFSYTDLGMYISTPTQSDSTKVYIGISAQVIGADEPTTADELTAPDGVLFMHPTSPAYALSLPDLSSGQRIAIWIKLVVSASSPGAIQDYCRIYTDGTES